MILIVLTSTTGCRSTTPSTVNEGSNQVPAEGIMVGNRAPDFQLNNLEGQAISLEGLQGKPVILNFWATWCPPCRYEMPFLQAIYDEYASQGLVLLEIDIGESLSTVKKYFADNNLSMPALLDSNNQVSSRYAITAIPTTFFIDKNGVIKFKKIGAFLSEDEIINELNKILP